MQRRAFIRVAGLSMVSVAGTPLWASDSSNRPNLLIIHTDEHNFRTLGCYRETLSPEQAFMWGKDAIVETPNIDWIAKNGALCKKFYATSPVCSPSRSSFVSGQYPQNTPVRKNDIKMKDDVVTFAETLGKNGYATGYAGKWHLDGSPKPGWAPKRKFGFDDNRYMYNRGHWKNLQDSGDTGRVVKGMGKEGSFTTDWLADKTISFIDKHKSGPFCYMVSIPDPHGPDRVRAPYSSQYTKMKFSTPRTANRDPETSPSWAMPRKGQTNLAQYFGMVKCIDDNVGKILDYLKKNKLIENTIVVFTSDHGDLCGEHGRHNKQLPLEASAKIPFVIHYSGKIKPGTIIEESLGCVDFLPTILGLMGVKTTGKEDGRDASQLFTTGKAPDDWKDITFMRGDETAPTLRWSCVLTQRYKLVLSQNDAPWLLDLEKDPDELKNFISDSSCRKVVVELASALKDYGDKYSDPSVKSPKIQSDIERCINGT